LQAFHIVRDGIVSSNSPTILLESYCPDIRLGTPRYFGDSKTGEVSVKFVLRTCQQP